jgi:hypothetical protein
MPKIRPARTAAADLPFPNPIESSPAGRIRAQRLPQLFYEDIVHK